jgi:hypothetical protein
MVISQLASIIQNISKSFISDHNGVLWLLLCIETTDALSLKLDEWSLPRDTSVQAVAMMIGTPEKQGLPGVVNLNGGQAVTDKRRDETGE